MPRRARIAIAGIPWHIIQRGNNRSVCFFTGEDNRYYLQTLQEQSEKYRCAIHAYVLMTNHVHLLITPEEKTSASLMMKHLGQRYTQYINKTYRRSGTLWEGRFKSCLAQVEQYILACYRYIELNPVRAGMVHDPADYPWSSHAYNAYGKTDTLISPHEIYQQLGNTPEEQRNHYRSLFQICLPRETLDNIRQATNGNYALGNDRFRDEIEQQLNRRATPRKAGRPKEK